jgi:tripartite ATP-independent transporter DctM subunit
MASILLVMVSILVVLLIIGVPIGFTFALSGIVGGLMAGFPIGTISSSAYYALASFPFLAIPLFILAGELMNRGKLIDRLTDLNELYLFWLPGRMGHISIVSSAFLGAMTGSSVATVAAISGSMGKKMIEKGYERGYVAALTAASGLLGVLIPPSIPLIVYGAAVGVSVAELFLATLIPGIVMTIAFMVVHGFSLRKVLSRESEAGKIELSTKINRELFENLGKKVLRAVPAVFMPVIILGGIYSGITTPTEAAAIAGVYTLLVILVLRLVKFKDLNGIFFSAAKTSGAIMCIIGFTAVFNKIMTLIQVPQKIALFTVELTDNKYIFLIFVNILLFLIGMFMETNAAVVLMSPLLYPAAVAMGVDPVHFGIILVTNIEIGLITPPMAANIYVSARVNESSVVEMLPHIMKYLLMAIVILMFITYIPELSLWWK